MMACYRCLLHPESSAVASDLYNIIWLTPVELPDDCFNVLEYIRSARAPRLRARHVWSRR